MVIVMGKNEVSEAYDRLFSFNRDVTEIERERIINTVNLIPDESNSILEVGCGDGRIIDSLLNKYPDVCGLDISDEALKHVKSPHVKGSLEELPFPENSYDTVICCEVLEHLPYSIYKKALKEIERVAKDYIIISVPYKENIESGMIKCPKCGCSFHMWRHLRSFDEKKLGELFKNFKVDKSQKQLLEQIYFQDFIIKIGKSLRNVTQFPETSLCPQCYYSLEKGSNTVEKDINTSKKSLLAKIMPKKEGSGFVITSYKVKK
jgi:ubiquinone/menaquinone biosynthesis C-methylase UbiE